MKREDFLIKIQTIDPLLKALDIITDEIFYFKIDNYPDYDFFPYQGEVGSNYYFKNKISYPDIFHSIIIAKDISENILDYESWENICFKLKIKNNNANNFFISHNELSNVGLSIEKIGYDTTVNEFQLNKFRILMVNNNTRTLVYDGAFNGDSFDIESTTYVIISKIQIKYIPKPKVKSLFIELISESYLLYHRGDFKLAFFILYSALENFINYELNSNDDDVRLKEKIKLLYKKRFNKLNKSQIYSSLLHSYNIFVKTRNIIAHGRENIIIKKKDVEELFLFVLISIISYNNEITTYDDLYEIIRKYC